MTVKELIEHLKTFPEDSEVFFHGYSCGCDFYNLATKSDFVLEHNSSNEPYVEIVADWN